MHAVVAWILALMLYHSPLDRPIQDPYAKEDPQAALVRYRSIATDIAEVAFDAEEAPLFGGDNARMETAALLAGIAFWEGAGYRRDIDTGIGPHARGDHGNSVCIMQINIGNRQTMEGYRRDDLLEDRKKCIRAGLHIAAYSFHICQGLPIDQRLRAYASGSCQKGATESRERVMTGLSWFYGHRPRFADDEVMKLIAFQREFMAGALDDEFAKN